MARQFCFHMNARKQRKQSLSEQDPIFRCLEMKIKQWPQHKQTKIVNWAHLNRLRSLCTFGIQPSETQTKPFDKALQSDKLACRTVSFALQADRPFLYPNQTNALMDKTGLWGTHFPLMWFCPADRQTSIVLHWPKCGSFAVALIWKKLSGITKLQVKLNGQACPKPQASENGHLQTKGKTSELAWESDADGSSQLNAAQADARS